MSRAVELAEQLIELLRGHHVVHSVSTEELATCPPAVEVRVRLQTGDPLIFEVRAPSPAQGEPYERP